MDFVDTRLKAYTTNEQKFKKYAIEIQQRLEIVSPVFVFIFIVTCKRLAQKEKRIFEKTKDYIEKIWLSSILHLSKGKIVENEEIVKIEQIGFKPLS